ncbi:hypothetical protein phiGM223_12 [Pseudomonas phage phiGM22-3]|uniref:Lipoprotein n=1 Tax=Pseudomonas phage phiGM22-3 TaxID=2816462 RepID=A0A8T8IVZ6_9CAUD|nr:hypothetical protein phiGM223_12 [Pseudomonas phage phiGM22-3]
MKQLSNWLVIVALCALVAGCVAWNVSLWNECRASNSWMYCMHVLSK